MEDEKQNNDLYTALDITPGPNTERESGQTSSGHKARTSDVLELEKKLVRLVVPVYVLLGLCLVVLVIFLGLWFVGKHAGNDVTGPTTPTKPFQSSRNITTTSSSTRAKQVSTESPEVARDCWDHRQNNIVESGVYPITLQLGNVGPRSIDVYCDMTTDGGGWTLLIRRQDGSVNFSRDWRDYKEGFGDPSGEYWIGNEAIHGLTKLNERSYEVHFTLTSNTNGTRHAKYSMFNVESEVMKYKLTAGGYTGNAGDSFGGHNGANFTTFDQNNGKSTINCAVRFTGGWWFKNCHSSMLTGTYGQDLGYAIGITWKAFLGYYNFLDYADMKIRPRVMHSDDM